MTCVAARGIAHLTLPSTRRYLGGGIPVGSITEFVGESTAGKTQLCLQLLLASQLPLDRGGLAGKAIYIHTEVRFGDGGVFCDRLTLELGESCNAVAPDLLRHKRHTVVARLLLTSFRRSTQSNAPVERLRQICSRFTHSSDEQVREELAAVGFTRRGFHSDSVACPS